MATSILPGGHSHFDQSQQFYPQSVYHGFPQQNSVVSDSHSQYGLLAAQEDSKPLTSSQTWPSQLSGRRGSSKSPNAHDRTPIRHRVSASRARSTSGSEALLAYATEQSLQQQQHQYPLNSTPLLQQNTPISSPPLFTTPAFTSLSQASPFLQQQGYYESPTAAGFPDIHNQHVSHNIPDYYSLSRSDVHTSPLSSLSLNSSDALYLQQTGQSRPSLPSMPTSALNFSSLPHSIDSTAGNIEVSSSRNKPQCWDHGCNGRQFSTFSNLLRHQREKSGTAAKARCPHCGTEFTRTTARNGHMYGGKCKGMPDGSKRSSISESVENSE